MTPWIIVTGDFRPHGGMDRANFALARYLAEAGCPVHLVTHRACSEITDIKNVTVHPVWRPFGSDLIGRPLLARAGRSWAGKLAAQGARVVVNGGNCNWGDVNWVHHVHAAYRPDNPAGRARAWKAQVAYAQALQAERNVLPKCRIDICNSQRSRQDIVERLGVPAERARVVYLGCDPEELALISTSERESARRVLGVVDERPLVAFVGGLGDRRKGFDTLFAAWADLCRDPQWDGELVVMGSGAELPTWRQKAEELGITKRIHFLGFRHDVPHVLAACDLLVHPARYEAYGLGVHEALCRGLPAIVTADAGVAERFPEPLQWLLLRDAEDVGQLKDLLQTWRERRRQTAAQVAAWCAQLRSRTWEQVAAEFVQVAEAAA